MHYTMHALNQMHYTLHAYNEMQYMMHARNEMQCTLHARNEMHYTMNARNEMQYTMHARNEMHCTLHVEIAVCILLPRRNSSGLMSYPSIRASCECRTNFISFWENGITPILFERGIPSNAAPLKATMTVTVAQQKNVKSSMSMMENQRCPKIALEVGGKNGGERK